MTIIDLGTDEVKNRTLSEYIDNIIVDFMPDHE